MRRPRLHFELAMTARRAATMVIGSKRISALVFFCLCLTVPAHLLSQHHTPPKRATSPPPPQKTLPPVLAPSPPLVLARSYKEGETLAYKITGNNQSRTETREYEARAEGTVVKAPSGVFVEEFAWTDLHLNADQVRLTAVSSAFREPLSLAQGSQLSVPDLGRVQTSLIGPITDLLTIYADVKIATNQAGLQREGDHVYVKYGAPSSWADGTRVVLGEDAVDFDVTLQSIDHTKQIATLLVRHVPPAQPQIKLPASWMTTPVGSAQNNWVQVEKGPHGKYVVGVGQETFDVTIKIALSNGRVVSATMSNPVEVLERVCKDAALAACGTPVHYRIQRRITLDAEP